MKKSTWCLLNRLFNPMLEGWYSECYELDCAVFGINLLALAIWVVIWLAIVVVGGIEWLRLL